MHINCGKEFSISSGFECKNRRFDKNKKILFSVKCLLNLFLPSEKQKNLHLSDIFSKKWFTELQLISDFSDVNFSPSKKRPKKSRKGKWAGYSLGRKQLPASSSILIMRQGNPERLFSLTILVCATPTTVARNESNIWYRKFRTGLYSFSAFRNKKD